MALMIVFSLESGVSLSVKLLSIFKQDTGMRVK